MFRSKPSIAVRSTDDPRSVLHRFYTVYRADGSRKLNNDLKELYAKEQEEIQVILARLSEETAQYIEEIRTDYRILTDLDFIFARGALAFSMNASVRSSTQMDAFTSVRGRHPLLDPKK